MIFPSSTHSWFTLFQHFWSLNHDGWIIGLINSSTHTINKCININTNTSHSWEKADRGGREKWVKQGGKVRKKDGTRRERTMEGRKGGNDSRHTNKTDIWEQDPTRINPIIPMQLQLLLLKPSPASFQRMTHSLVAIEEAASTSFAFSIRSLDLSASFLFRSPTDRQRCLDFRSPSCSPCRPTSTKNE